jgi:hypothetical protein
VFKKTAVALMSVLWLATLAPIRSLADDLFIYPTKNQSADQQDKDKWDCRAWATGQSGFDPAARPKASTPPPVSQAPKGRLLRCAAGGAAMWSWSWLDHIQHLWRERCRAACCAVKRTATSL